MTIARTPYGDLPRSLIDELTAAGLDPVIVYGMVETAFEEDLPHRGVDVTSESMPSMGSGTADFVAREPGVVAGLAVAELAFVYAMDGAVESCPTGCPTAPTSPPVDAVLRVSGPLKELLTAERTALNFASPPLRRRDRHRPLGRRARGHPRAGARHPQDAARLPRAPEVRRALRRGSQPPLQPAATGRWSRTTTCWPPAGWCRRTRRCARPTPTCGSRWR